MPSFTQSGYLCEFKSTWETMIEKWHAKTILSSGTSACLILSNSLTIKLVSRIINISINQV